MPTKVSEESVEDLLRSAASMVRRPCLMVESPPAPVTATTTADIPSPSVQPAEMAGEIGRRKRRCPGESAGQLETCPVKRPRVEAGAAEQSTSGDNNTNPKRGTPLSEGNVVMAMDEPSPPGEVVKHKWFGNEYTPQDVNCKRSSNLLLQGCV